MGRAFRNAWLLPFVHRRLRDDDPQVVTAAINAAGGLGFPALEEAVSAFLEPSVAPPLRHAAIAALGRMGAMSGLAPGGGSRDLAPGELDAGIAGVFPSFAHMVKLKGFEALVKSIRTAESLYRSVVTVSDADLSPPIVLWMQVLENYVHAWLGARMNTIQRDPLPLFAHVDQLVSSAWPKYSQFVSQRWPDPMQVGAARRGAARVELPVRSLPNALRDLQEHKRKRLDSPLSVTEWARLMVFFAVDHPSGVKNLFKLPVKTADQSVRLAHRLHTLAMVRNLVTHRSTASAPTLEAFRKSYYAAFEDLAQMA